MNVKNIPYSILELATVSSHSTPEETFKKSLDLAQKAEGFGYKRFWRPTALLLINSPCLLIWQI
jgi:hypothetical protein